MSERAKSRLVALLVGWAAGLLVCCPVGWVLFGWGVAAIVVLAAVSLVVGFGLVAWLEWLGRPLPVSQRRIHELEFELGLRDDASSLWSDPGELRFGPGVMIPVATGPDDVTDSLNDWVVSRCEWVADERLAPRYSGYGGYGGYLRYSRYRR